MQGKRPFEKSIQVNVVGPCIVWRNSKWNLRSCCSMSSCPEADTPCWGDKCVPIACNVFVETTRRLSSWSTEGRWGICRKGELSVCYKRGQKRRMKMCERMETRRNEPGVASSGQTIHCWLGHLPRNRWDPTFILEMWKMLSDTIVVSLFSWFMSCILIIPIQWVVTTFLQWIEKWSSPALCLWIYHLTSLHTSGL